MDAQHHTVPPGADRGHLVVSEMELIGWGERLGAESHPNLVIALTGELGAEYSWTIAYVGLVTGSVTP